MKEGHLHINYVCMAVIAAVEDFIISRDRREDGSSRSENSGAGGGGGGSSGGN